MDVSLVCSSRTFLGAVAGVAIVSTLVACAPKPVVSAAPTELFPTEEQAYVAAAETYRGYIGALNRVNFADPQSFEGVFVWLTGPALSTERESVSVYHAESLTRTGDTTIVRIEPESFDGSEVVIDVCIDVSEVEVVDSNGESIVPADRPP